jgi:hypothetical protein
MIDETYAVFAAWDFGSSKKENLDRLRRENFIGTSTAARLRDFIFVLNRRFDPNDRDRPLVRLAQSGCPIEEMEANSALAHDSRRIFASRFPS